MNESVVKSGRRSLAVWLGDIKNRIEGTLSAMLEKEALLGFETPMKLSAKDFDDLLQEGPVVVTLAFGDEMNWYLLLPQSLAGLIADVASTGDGSADFNSEVHLATLQEIFGQVEADLEPEISTLTGAGLEIAPVEVSLSADTVIAKAGGHPAVVAHLRVEGFDSRKFIILFGQKFISQFDLSGGLAEKETGSTGSPKQEKTMPNIARPAPLRETPVARPAAFEDFGPVAAHKAEKNGQNIDSLLDISLPIIIELGRTKMLIREVLDLCPGSVIELDKLSGEPVDLYVNDKKFARGEVVVIEENFGVRITELVKVEERIKALK